MPIVPLYGHEQLQQRLVASMARGALPSSLLLHGPRGVGKQRLALWIAQVLLCAGAEPRPCERCSQCRFSAVLTHPDLQWVFPRPRPKDADPSADEVREDYAEAVAERVARGGLYPPSAGLDGIFVATVRAIVRTAAMSPAMSRRKVIVVGDAERMVPQEGSEAAANAFLKLLEEPLADTTVILTSSEPGGLLPTIRSRVAAVRVPLIGETAVRAFLEDPIVSRRLGEDGIERTTDELVAACAGAPGHLFGQSSWADAISQARRMLDIAGSRDRASRFRLAFAQGGSRARGSYSETLDALTALLHERARGAAQEGDDRAALGAARAMAVVEEAKERAGGNVNPQLLSAALLKDLAGLLA